MSLLFGCAAAASLAVMATTRLTAVIPLHHMELAWTLTRVLIEF